MEKLKKKKIGKIKFEKIIPVQSKEYFCNSSERVDKSGCLFSIFTSLCSTIGDEGFI